MKVGDIVKVKLGFEVDLSDKGLLGIVVERHAAAIDPAQIQAAYAEDRIVPLVPWVRVALPHRTARYRVHFLEIISESR